MNRSPRRGLHLSPRHLEIRSKSKVNFTSRINEFMRERGIAFTLAFSGGADDSSLALDSFRDSLANDERIPEAVRAELPARAKESAKQNVAALVRTILEPLRGYRIAILSGGTTWGVPDVVTRVAKELGFCTIGVYPLTAQVKGNALPKDLLDLSICVHPFVGESTWGDESAIFTKLLDSVIVIGGNAGTMVEVAHLLKINEKKGINKWIVPVYGTGGTADKLSTFPGKPDTLARCTPRHPIRTGQEVVDFLIKMNVLSEDIYEPPT